MCHIDHDRLSVSRSHQQQQLKGHWVSTIFVIIVIIIIVAIIVAILAIITIIVATIIILLVITIIFAIILDFTPPRGDDDGIEVAVTMVGATMTRHGVEVGEDDDDGND